MPVVCLEEPSKGATAVRIDPATAKAEACSAGVMPDDEDGHPPVRLGTLADIDDLVSIEHRAFSCNRITRRGFSRFVLSPRTVLMVQEQPSRCVGYVLLLFHPAGRIARIYSLAVDPLVRGAGVGCRLLSAAVRAAQVRQAAILRLEVSDGNAAAQRLYLKSGFEVFGRHQSYYSDGSNALRMQKSV